LYEWEGAKNADLDAAIKNSKKALELAPNLSESHASHGFALSQCKRYDEAAQEFREAIRLNLNSYDAYYYYARLCFARGHMEQSAELFLKASEIRREDFQSILLLGQVYRVLATAIKNTMLSSKGVKRLRKYVQLNPDDIRALSFGAGSLLEVGDKEEAFQWMNRALELDPNNAGVLINGSCLFAKAGDKERALDVLEQAVNLGYGKKDWMENDPDYDDIRDEPRFKELMERIR
jgi:Flp pilus assembly protein TadD